ncbi:MAG: carbohydrate ABC transporter permease [Waltera sp.]
MILITITMFINGGMIPFYQTLQDLRLLETHLGLVIPFAISTYNMIILRTSFESIPESLSEAARIDGAGHFTILFKIILPLSKSILAVMALYYGVGTWNGLVLGFYHSDGQNHVSVTSCVKRDHYVKRYHIHDGWHIGR